MKWPRTYHLPWSEGVSRDDLRLDSVSHFEGKRVIITEKLDGENTSLHRDCVHARSENQGDHPSRSWIKKLHGEIAYKIPENIQIVGENVYAKHSIFYDKLTTYFYVFAVIDKQSAEIWSVSHTMQFCEELGLEFVPVRYHGIFSSKGWSIYALESKFGSVLEGYVVRLVDGFSVKDFDKSVAKWVRKDHVQTDEHWSKNWEQNRLR